MNEQPSAGSSYRIPLLMGIVRFEMTTSDEYADSELLDGPLMFVVEARQRRPVSKRTNHISDEEVIGQRTVSCI